MFKEKYSYHFLFIITAIITAVVFTCGYTAGRYNKKTTATVTENTTPYTTNAAAETEPTATTAAVSETEPAFIDLGKFEITAYCTCAECCGKSDGITASGTKATAGRTVAVDPYVIPYGTEIIINGHTYVAEDTGGAINGNKIDICVGSHEEALNYGVQYETVYKAP